MPAFARLGDSSMKGVARNSLISGDVTVGFSQLRVRTRFGLAGLLRYAQHEVRPRLSDNYLLAVEFDLLGPWNLSQEEAPARGSTGAQVFRTAGPLEKASPMRLARSGLGYCGKAATARKKKGAGRSRRPYAP
jgi:hypothetical protein